MPRAQQSRGRGAFGIGIEHGKTAANLGTLFRSAVIMGADYVFTVGRRYTHQASDTVKSWRHLPLFHYVDIADLKAHLPLEFRLVGIELDQRAKPLADFCHFERCVYLLGAEDQGLTRAALDSCHALVQLPGAFSMNVAVAGSIVMYDRIAKAAHGIRRAA